jgi:Fe-S cluster assembly protein SufD
MSQLTTPQEEFLARFSRVEAEAQQRGPAWLREVRRDGLERFRQVGFPSGREEEWKNTSLEPIRQTRFVPAAARRVAADELPGIARLDEVGPRLVFVDGRYAAQLSTVDALPAGAWIGSLEHALEQIPERVRGELTRRSIESMTAFRALNSGLAADGALVLVPQGAQLERPIQVIHAATADGEPSATHPRTLVIAGRSSRLVLIESYVGLGAAPYLTNAVTDVGLAADASVEHYRVQLEGEQSYHVSSVEIRQAADSRYRSCNLDLGGRLARHDLRNVLEGVGAESRVDGLYLTRGRQHVDNHTVIEHAEPHCASRELFKGILAGRSRSVFNGRIIVRQRAQQTDAKQSNPNLLLSGNALAHTRPQLEIYADDVKCTHGATIGRLDDDAVFYLRSRAIPEPLARRLLIRAFAGEVLDRIDPPSLKQLIEQQVDARLESALEE